jgi:hypothetical protein
MNHVGKYFTALASAVTAAALLSGCGGGDAGAPFSPTPLAGFAVDGYLKDSSVKCDASGVVVKTDSSGFFRFPDGCSSSVTLTGGTSMDTQLPFAGQLKAPAGATVITPLTTLLADGVTLTDLNNALGLPKGTDLLNADPAYAPNGVLFNEVLMKVTASFQLALQKTTELLIGLAGGTTADDKQAIYNEVAAAASALVKGGSVTLVTGTGSNAALDQTVIASFVKAAALRVGQASAVSTVVKTAVNGVNAESLGLVVAGGLKVQTEAILKSGTALTTVTLAQQNDTQIATFVAANKTALGGAPATVTTLATTLTSQFAGSGSGGGSSGGSCGTTAPTCAPTAPTALAADVQSLYSDAYTSVAGFILPNWGQGQMLANTMIAGNNVLAGTAFTYQGFEFSPINATALGLTSMHIDVWSADATPVKVYVISAGKDTVSVDVVPTAGAWKGVDIPLSTFTNIDKTAIFQVKLDTALQPVTKVMYFDNIYFGKAGTSSGGGTTATAPTTAPTAPTALAADVQSLYSDAYTSVAGFILPNWGQGQMLANTMIAGNNVLAGTAFTYQGFEFSPINVTALGLTSMHIDVWSADATPVKVYVISAGKDTVSVDVVPTAGAWKGVDIPLSTFTNIDKTAIFQVKLDTALQPVTKVMYFDNIYFKK